MTKLNYFALNKKVDNYMNDTQFLQGTLTEEEGFLVMWYFLQGHYELAGGQFDISDILSASEPITFNGSNVKRPADSGMIWHWNEAVKKFRAEGIPPLKTLTK